MLPVGSKFFPLIIAPLRGNILYRIKKILTGCVSIYCLLCVTEFETAMYFAVLYVGEFYFYRALRG